MVLFHTHANIHTRKHSHTQVNACTHTKGQTSFAKITIHLMVPLMRTHTHLHIHILSLTHTRVCVCAARHAFAWLRYWSSSQFVQPHLFAIRAYALAHGAHLCDLSACTINNQSDRHRGAIYSPCGWRCHGPGRLGWSFGGGECSERGAQRRQPGWRREQAIPAA